MNPDYELVANRIDELRADLLEAERMQAEEGTSEEARDQDLAFAASVIRRYKRLADSRDEGRDILSGYNNAKIQDALVWAERMAALLTKLLELDKGALDAIEDTDEYERSGRADYEDQGPM